MRLAQFRYNVESCIRTLSDMARNRSIAIPSDLDKNQVSSLFNKPAQIMLGKASKIFRSSRLQSAQLSRESSQSQVWLFLVFHPVNRLTVFFFTFQLGVRFDRSIIDWSAGHCGSAGIPAASSGSIRVVRHCRRPLPTGIFQPRTDARKKCDNGGFIRRLVVALVPALNFKFASLNKFIFARLYRPAAVQSRNDATRSASLPGQGRRL